MAMNNGANLVLDKLHSVCRTVDHGRSLRLLLNEYNRGMIADRDRTLEDHVIRTVLRKQRAAWEHVFPSFPQCRWKRRTAMWEHARGRRDAYLKRLLVRHVPLDRAQSDTIVNPAAAFGRHARCVAREMPGYEVLGTDIDPRWNRLCHLASVFRGGSPANYRFVAENIFEPALGKKPTAVMFFGACGSVTDGCMDYAIRSSARFLICRTCCHDNIGGNTEVTKRKRYLNWFFRRKNDALKRIKRKKAGFYFSDRYEKDAYPRSQVARELVDSDTVIEIAKNTPDSDICRASIDLDRCLYLQENGYDVLYSEELFFAHLRD